MPQATVDAPTELAFHRLSASLGREGWRVYRTRRGVKARCGWLSVSVKHRARAAEEKQWRARLRDGFPREVVDQVASSEPLAALDPIIEHARKAKRLACGPFRFGLGPSYMGHRVWQSVRPRR